MDMDTVMGMGTDMGIMRRIRGNLMAGGDGLGIVIHD
jgi:hypothetical protein